LPYGFSAPYSSVVEVGPIHRFSPSTGVVHLIVFFAKYNGTARVVSKPEQREYLHTRVDAAGFKDLF